jgi:ubiquinone/menaquinone biosynthesis C-methylase UbiE
VKTNWPEKIWVNSPVRSLIQGRETLFFQDQQPLPAGSACLEIGCGRGAGVSLIAKRFHPRRIDAIDIDPSMVRLAKRRGRGANRVQGVTMEADAQALPYRDACFDAVFNFGILHHLEDWRLGLEEVARVLRKGGRFYFEEIYSPLYANVLFRRVLAHPRENRFRGMEFRAALAGVNLRLRSGFRETRFFILGVALKD